MTRNVRKSIRGRTKFIDVSKGSASHYIFFKWIVHDQPMVEHINFCPLCYKQFIVLFLNKEGSSDITINDCLYLLTNKAI